MTTTTKKSATETKAPKISKKDQKAAEKLAKQAAKAEAERTEQLRADAIAKAFASITRSDVTQIEIIGGKLGDARVDVTAETLPEAQKTIKSWDKLRELKTTFVVVTTKGERAEAPSFAVFCALFDVVIAAKEEKPPVDTAALTAGIDRIVCELGKYRAELMNYAKGIEAAKRVVKGWTAGCFKGARYTVFSRGGRGARSVALAEICGWYDVTPPNRPDAKVPAPNPVGVSAAAVPMTSLVPVAAPAATALVPEVVKVKKPCKGKPDACGCDAHVAARDAARGLVVVKRTAKEVAAELQAQGVNVRVADETVNAEYTPPRAPAGKRKMVIEFVEAPAPSAKVAPKFFTIGYGGGLTVGAVAEIMDKRGIKLLIDTRQRNSKVPGWSFDQTMNVFGGRYRHAGTEREIVDIIGQLEKESGGSALFLRREEAPGDSDLHLALARAITVTHFFRDEEVDGAELQAAIDLDATSPTTEEGGHAYNADIMSGELLKFHRAAPGATPAQAASAA
jgi:hypothetical protein